MASVINLLKKHNLFSRVMSIPLTSLEALRIKCYLTMLTYNVHLDMKMRGRKN
jgi:hypothetical protein